MGYGLFLKTLLITFTAAIITYNILISSKTPLPSSIFVDSSNDPVIKLPKNRKSQLGLSSKRLFHTAVTASDGVYNAWQCRVMYYWFKKFQNQPGSEMGGFTRILHTGLEDKFMDEIPTFVVQPLPPGKDEVISLIVHVFFFFFF